MNADIKGHFDHVIYYISHIVCLQMFLPGEYLGVTGCVSSLESGYVCVSVCILVSL